MKKIYLLLLVLFVSQLNAQENSFSDDGRTIKIPVIIHLLKLNNGKSIKDSQIIQELKELNSNFTAKNNMSSLNEDFKNLVGNPNFEFYLADTTLNNSSLKGIIRYSSISNISNKLNINPEKYLNIFIGNNKTSSNVLQERKLPKNIKINYTKIGNKSNTITHEIGHYFGLWHVWGSGNCSRFKNPFRQKTDEISDTPKQKNCTDVKRINQCPPRKVKKTPNYNNFMDYSSCRCFFTIGQASKMREKVIKYRNHVYQNSK